MTATSTITHSAFWTVIMDTERKSFIFHRDWFDAISSLSQNDRCEVYDAIMQKVWGNDDIKLSPIAEIAMKFIAPQIERDTDKWLEIKAKRQVSGKQGGLAKQANATKCYQMLPNDSKSKQTVANLPNNVSVSDNVSVVTKDVNKELSSLHSDNNISTEVDSSSSSAWVGNFVKFFNETIDENHSVIAKVRIIQGNREKQLKARLKQYGEEALHEAVIKAAQSSFLNGQKNFVASIDWILKPNNFPKILEGNYDDREENINTYGRTRTHAEKLRDTLIHANEFSRQLHEQVGKKPYMGGGDKESLW